MNYSFNLKPQLSGLHLTKPSLNSRGDNSLMRFDRKEKIFKIFFSKNVLKLQRTIAHERNSPQTHHTFSCFIPPLGQVSDQQKQKQKKSHKQNREGGRV